MNEKNRDYYKMMLGFLIFFISSSFLVIFARDIIGINIDTSKSSTVVNVDFYCSLFITIMLSTIYFKKLINDLKTIKTKYGKIYNFIFNVFIAFIGLMGVKAASGIAENFINSLLHLTTMETDNQAAVVSMLNNLPALMIISTVLFAPIEEEVLFRCGIRRIIKNKRVFVTVSGLIFGFMHITGSLTLLIEILLLGVVTDMILNSKMNKRGKKIISVICIIAITFMFGFVYYFQYGNLIEIIKTIKLTELTGSISYITAGLYFAYLYAKNDNIWFNILVHASNNALCSLIILFI